MKDQRGVVYLETLVAFLPVFLFFLATLQIADLSAAHIIVRHAATVAARAAVVVMPDDGRYYNDEDNEKLHTFDGLRRQDIEHAADRILRANPRLDNAPSNVVVGFQSPPRPASPSPNRFGCDQPSAAQPCMSRDEVLAAAFTSQSAGELLDTSTKGEGDWGMREKLDALVTVKYRCMIRFFCPRDFTVVGTASLLYQGARYTYEAWPDSIRSDSRPGSTPAAPVAPPSQTPGGPTSVANNAPGTSPSGSTASNTPSTSTDGSTASNNTGPVANNASSPGSNGSTRPGSGNNQGSNGQDATGSTAPTGPIAAANNGNGAVASNTPATSVTNANGTVASNTTPHGSRGAAPNTAPGSTANSPMASGDTSPTSNSSVSRTPASSARPSVVAREPSDGHTPAVASSTAADSSDDDGAHPTQTHAATAAANNPTRGPAPTRGPPGSSPTSLGNTQGVIARAVTADDSSGSPLPQSDGNRANLPDSSASIVANSPDTNSQRSAANAADRGSRAPRNLTELRAQLPSDIRSIPIVRDPSLQGNAVRAHYTYDARGRVTSVELRVGPTAQPRHIADHVNTVRTLQGYQGLSGRVRIVLDKLNAWIAGHPNVRPGSLAWETRREVEKLRAIVDARTRALDGTHLSDTQRAELESERREYARQLARHEANLDRITHEPGRGYVAAEASDGSAADDLSDLRAALPSDLANIPIVRAPSLPNGTVRPGFVRDSVGRITGVEIRVGPGATAEGVQAQLEQIAALQKYQSLPAQARELHARANRYLIANRGAGPGTVAHETRRKLEIFSAIIAARTDALALDSLDPAHRAEVEQFLATYERGLGSNAITTDTTELTLHLEAYAEFLDSYQKTLDAIEENPALGATPASDLSVNQALITDRDRSVFDTSPRPSELVLDRRQSSAGITRAVVNRANAAARNQGLPNNSDHGIFVRAPNGTFVRYLPLNHGRPQGVVALVDAAYLARETNAAQGRGDKAGMGRKATGKDVVGRRPEQDRGHLLANILGGGDIPQNLFPLESGINQQEMSQAEVALRNDILNRSGRFWIRTDVIYDEVTGEPRSLVVRVTDATVDEQGRVQPPAERDATEAAYWYPNYFVDPNAGQPASTSHPTAPTAE